MMYREYKMFLYWSIKKIFTCRIYSCLNCDLVDVVCEPDGNKASSLAQRFHIVVVASAVAFKVFVGIIPAVLALVLLNVKLLVDLQNILGHAARLRLESITGGKEHVVVHISVCLNTFSLHQYLDSFSVGAFQVEV